WTDARFDFQHEDLVRRQQIPLTRDELFADAERFLAGIRDESGALSPSMVLEQDVARTQDVSHKIPTEVYGVLRMFDGHRVLADVLEDSPYRVFETLRVAQRALEAGLLRVASPLRAKSTWRAVLAIEEWLVGGETREDVVARGAIDNTGPIAKVDGTTGKTKKPSFKKKGRRANKRRINTPVAVTTTSASSPPDIDWGALVPRTVGAEVGSLSGVVPSSQQSGEIVLPSAPSRDAPRERLETLMDTAERERIFPSELRPDAAREPSVVLDDGASTTSEVGATPVDADEIGARPAGTPTPPATANELVQALLDDERGTRELRSEANLVEETPASVVVSSPELPRTSASAPHDSDDSVTRSFVRETIDDEPSDGVIRDLDTQPSPPRPTLLAPPPAAAIPVDDRPPEAVGEIRAAASNVSSAPIADAAEPSILVADLQSAHTAVSAAANATRPAGAANVDASTRAAVAEVQQVQQDATAAFTEIEEEFFRAGATDAAQVNEPSGTAQIGAPQLASASDSFDDLDEGYERVGFWDRLLGRKKKNK
ncbi:MAG TPA: hypothetical protein VK427_07285, partial [Kofleriaceae bacterium]|nr:hypothetical protein [Kofleriaceae bacterium]